MGRVTYEKFFANWGHIAGNPYIDLINAMPKYVASRSLTETAWNAALLRPDPSSAIANGSGRRGSTPCRRRLSAGRKQPGILLIECPAIDEVFQLPPTAHGARRGAFLLDHPRNEGHTTP
jgi:hypothetical protein